jgi:hypothetical protein
MSPSFVDVYIRGHRGSNPQNPDELCDEGATQRLVSIKNPFFGGPLHM